VVCGWWWGGVGGGGVGGVAVPVGMEKVIIIYEQFSTYTICCV